MLVAYRKATRIPCKLMINSPKATSVYRKQIVDYRKQLATHRKPFAIHRKLIILPARIPLPFG